MTERQPPMAEDSSTLSAPAHKSETPLGLPEHSGVTEALPAEEREEPQACPGEDTKESQPRSTTELKPPVPHRAEPEPPAPCLPALSGPPLPSCRGQAEPPEARPGIQLGASVASALQAGNPESSPEPCCSQGPPATTSLTSSQSPVCASFPIHSLHSSRSPTGRSGKELAEKDHEGRALSGSGSCLAPPHAMLYFPCTSKWLCSWEVRGGGDLEEI